MRITLPQSANGLIVIEETLPPGTVSGEPGRVRLTLEEWTLFCAHARDSSLPLSQITPQMVSRAISFVVNNPDPVDSPEAWQTHIRIMLEVALNIRQTANERGIDDAKLQATLTRSTTSEPRQSALGSGRRNRTG